MSRGIGFTIVYGIVAAVAVAKLSGCASAVPTAVDEAKVSMYGAALAVCVKDSDSSAAYADCACKVDTSFGIRDAGCAK